MAKNSRAKGNRNENLVKELMESKGFLVEKQKAKFQFAKGSTDFWNTWDLLCLPTKECRYDVPYFIQVRSRKQYGKEIEEIRSIFGRLKPTFVSYVAWPDGRRGHRRIWKFRHIDPTRAGNDSVFDAEDL